MDYHTLNGVLESIDVLIADCDFLEQNFDANCIKVTGRNTYAALEKVRNAKKLLYEAKTSMKSHADKMAKVDGGMTSSDAKEVES